MLVNIGRRNNIPDRPGERAHENHGDRMFLKQDEEIEMIKAINHLLDKKVPDIRRNYTKTTKIRTVIREEPIKLVQYIRGNALTFPVNHYL